MRSVKWHDTERMMERGTWQQKHRGGSADMSGNDMRRSEEEICVSARLGAGEEEHSYSLSVDQLTSGFVACPHCGIWVSNARSFIKVNMKKHGFPKGALWRRKNGRETPNVTLQLSHQFRVEAGSLNVK